MLKKTLNPDRKYSLPVNIKTKMHPSTKSSGRWTNKKQLRRTPPACQRPAPTRSCQIELNLLHYNPTTYTSRIVNYKPYSRRNNVVI